ncbi:MAG: hypothetical protein JO321_05205 [Solirubrobacterales bacterium]|nr:hypothetical protein [Solirubrobacterales bacterium]
MATKAITTKMQGRELTSAEAFELAAFYARYGLVCLAAQGENVHPGVRRTRSRHSPNTWPSERCLRSRQLT